MIFFLIIGVTLFIMNKTTDVQASSVRYEGEEFLDKVHPSFLSLIHI